MSSEHPKKHGREESVVDILMSESEKKEKERKLVDLRKWYIKMRER